MFPVYYESIAAGPLLVRVVRPSEFAVWVPNPTPTFWDRLLHESPFWGDWAYPQDTRFNVALRSIRLPELPDYLTAITASVFPGALHVFYHHIVGHGGPKGDTGSLQVGVLLRPGVGSLPRFHSPHGDILAGELEPSFPRFIRRPV